MNKKELREKALSNVLEKHPTILDDINESLIKTIKSNSKGSLSAIGIFLDMNGLKSKASDETTQSAPLSKKEREKRMRELLGEQYEDKHKVED